MTFTDLLDQLNIPYRRAGEHHHVRPGWVGIDCPFCTPGMEKFRLGYNLAGKYFTCWACAKVNSFSVLHELTQGSVQANDVPKLYRSLTRESIKEEVRIRGTLVVPEKVGDLKKAHTDYLKSRNLNPKEIVRTWKIQGIGNAPKLSWRLFIPVHYKEEVVSWTTRSISDKVKLRYISASPDEERTSLKRLLYGEQLVRNAICVVEGPVDVWKIGPGAVCTFGLSYKQAQLKRMARFPVRMIWFDQEPEAQRRAQKLVNNLSVFPGTTYLVESDAKDPGSAPDKEIRRIRRMLGT